MNSATNAAVPGHAQALLTEAKQHADLAGMIMAGNTHIASWLIEHRILPDLWAAGAQAIRLQCGPSPEKTAVLLPFADGSAFICNTEGHWDALGCREALEEIEYLGYRFAPGDHWESSLAVHLGQPDANWCPISPPELAAFWTTLTGQAPRGFDEGGLDQASALGLSVLDSMFGTKRRLGL